MSEISLTKTSAISLEKIAVAAPGLLDHYREAEKALRAGGGLGERAAVSLAFDRSGSMRPYYADGTVQAFAERVLSLAAHLDDDGIVPLVFFSTDVHTHTARRGLLHHTENTFDVSLTDYQGRIAAIHENLGHMGGTNYAPAMQVIIDQHLKSPAARGGVPTYVIFQTDGAPQDRAAVIELLRSSSSLGIFWLFVGFGGDADAKEFAFLRRLDELDGRVVDNAAFFAAGRDPRAMSDGELFHHLVSDYLVYLREARAAGVLR